MTDGSIKSNPSTPQQYSAARRQAAEDYSGVVAAMKRQYRSATASYNLGIDERVTFADFRRYYAKNLSEAEAQKLYNSLAGSDGKLEGRDIDLAAQHIAYETQFKADREKVRAIDDWNITHAAVTINGKTPTSREELETARRQDPSSVQTAAHAESLSQYRTSEGNYKAADAKLNAGIASEDVFDNAAQRKAFEARKQQEAVERQQGWAGQAWNSLKYVTGLGTDHTEIRDAAYSTSQIAFASLDACTTTAETRQKQAALVQNPNEIDKLNQQISAYEKNQAWGSFGVKVVATGVATALTGGMAATYGAGSLVTTGTGASIVDGTLGVAVGTTDAATSKDRSYTGGDFVMDAFGGVIIGKALKYTGLGALAGKIYTAAADGVQNLRLRAKDVFAGSVDDVVEPNVQLASPSTNGIPSSPTQARRGGSLNRPQNVPINLSTSNGFSFSDPFLRELKTLDARFGDNIIQAIKTKDGDIYLEVNEYFSRTKIAEALQIDAGHLNRQVDTFTGKPDVHWVKIPKNWQDLQIKNTAPSVNSTSGVHDRLNAIVSRHSGRGILSVSEQNGKYLIYVEPSFSRSHIENELGIYPNSLSRNTSNRQLGYDVIEVPSNKIGEADQVLPEKLPAVENEHTNYFSGLLRGIFPKRNNVAYNRLKELAEQNNAPSNLDNIVSDNGLVRKVGNEGRIINSNYKLTSAEARLYLANAASDGKLYSTPEAYKRYLEEAHRLSYGGKSGRNVWYNEVGGGSLDVNPGQIRGAGKLSSQRDEMASLAERVSRKYGGSYSTSANQTLDLNGIPLEARPINLGSKHFYPDGGSVLDLYFKQMARTGRECLNLINKGASQSSIIKKIAEHYQYAANARPFGQINNSLFMNEVNLLLRTAGLKEIPHGDLDHIAQRVDPDAFARYFHDYVLSFQ